MTTKRTKALKAIHQLLTRPSFTAAEAKELGVSAALLGYHVKVGHIRRLGRGIYQGIDRPSPIENFWWEDLIDAVHSVPGGIICLVSALAIYEITDEIPRKHWIAISNSTSIDRGNSVKIVRLRNMKLGKTVIHLGGVQVPIFDRERTIIDSFRLLSRETAIKALKMALSPRNNQRLDLLKLQAYAKKLRVNISHYLISFTT